MQLGGIGPRLILLVLAISVLGCESILGIHAIDHPGDGPDAAGAGAKGSEFVLDTEAESFDEQVSIDGTHNWVEQDVVGGFFGTHYLESMPDEGANCDDRIDSCGARLGYDFVATEGGAYYVHWHINTEGPGDDSFSWNIDTIGAALPSSDNEGPHNVWKWRRTEVAQLNPGDHTLYLWMREGGMRVDRIVVTQESDPDLPAGTGP